MRTMDSDEIAEFYMAESQYQDLVTGVDQSGGEADEDASLEDGVELLGGTSEAGMPASCATF